MSSWSPSPSSSRSDSTSVVDREISRPEVYRSWKSTLSAWACRKILPRRSSSTSWLTRADALMKAYWSAPRPARRPVTGGDRDQRTVVAVAGRPARRVSMAYATISGPACTAACWSSRRERRRRRPAARAARAASAAGRGGARRRGQLVLVERVAGPGAWRRVVRRARPVPRFAPPAGRGSLAGRSGSLPAGRFVLGLSRSAVVDVVIGRSSHGALACARHQPGVLLAAAQQFLMGAHRGDPALARAAPPGRRASP